MSESSDEHGGDSALGARSVNTGPSRLGSAYCSDSDSPSRTKSNQRTRTRRRQTQDRMSEDNNVPQSNNSSHSMRHELRAEPSNVNMVPPISQNIDNPINMPYPHMPPPYWNNNKANQDMRTNQFTQNSHSQTMERLMGTPQMSFPPSMPFNMMMPYGMVGGCGCGCGFWGAWCWQQLVLQQREIHALRDQLALLEERWRAETASHTLNNQVPPGNRANNYWDNFRSYSRQNLLSANNKTNADGQPGGGAAAAPPLVERSHNALRRPRPAPPAKRNTDDAPAPAPSARRDRVERSLSFCSAPDVLNVNRHPDDPPADRNLNRAPVPELVRAHSNNLDAPPDPDPNLAVAGRDKAASKLFDLLRENVYSEVTALIDVNESHPDFLVQLFKELRLISSDPLRQRVLRSIRGVLSRPDSRANETREERADPAVSTTDVEPADLSLPVLNACSTTSRFDDGIVRFLLQRSEEICTPELLEALAGQIMNGGAEGRRPRMSKRLLDYLSKYEGMRVCNVSNDIIESLPLAISAAGDGEESALASELSESSILQDVAGSLDLFNSSDPQPNACPYDMWGGHVHMDIEGDLTESPRSSQEKVDLINCSEMHDGDLAEADQTCRDEPPPDALPDVVDTEEPAPAEVMHQVLYCRCLPLINCANRSDS